jgi:hypothetical protein
VRRGEPAEYQLVEVYTGLRNQILTLRPSEAGFERSEEGQSVWGMIHYVSPYQPVSEYPLPKKGHTRLYLLTFDGIVSREAREEDLGFNRHMLSPPFHAAQKVITEIRLVEERKH